MDIPRETLDVTTKPKRYHLTNMLVRSDRRNGKELQQAIGSAQVGA